ncbi:MAG: transcriptional repressor [Clostridiales bacterium]
MAEQKQKRMTRQKKLIYEILCSTVTHPTADWIYEEARKKIPDISLGTVYRNLQVMREEGQIIELNYGKNQSRFDGNAQPHYHFVCEKCGRVLDFEPNHQLVGEDVLSAAPGVVKAHRLECYGICKDCLH